jgi:hypothetical protein
MGDWSFKPWGTDEAADWFHKFWKGKDISLLVDEIENFDPRAEGYERLRAAAYLLQVLGITFVWPVEHSGKLKPLLTKTVAILENFIAPPDDDWGFLDAWGNVPGVVDEVKEQIAALRQRLRDLA